MKYFSLIVLLLGLAQCGENPSKPTSPVYSIVATDTSTPATLSNGLPSVIEFKITSGDEEITIITDDKKAGKYTIIYDTTVPKSGNQHTFAAASYVTGSDRYTSRDGEVNVAVDSNGDYSIDFKINFINVDSVVLAKSGQTNKVGLAKATIPTGKCLLSSIEKWDSHSGGYKLFNYYDSEGRLVKSEMQLYSSNRFSYFLWGKDKVIGAVYTQTQLLPYSPGYVNKENWFYNNGNLSRVVNKWYDDSYSLNVAGQPLNYNYDDNGNVISGTTAMVYYYDTNANPLIFLSRSVGVTILPRAYMLDYDPSKNNIVKIEGGTYDREGLVHTLIRNCSYDQNRLIGVSYFSNIPHTESYGYIGCR